MTLLSMMRSTIMGRSHVHLQHQFNSGLLPVEFPLCINQQLLFQLPSVKIGQMVPFVELAAEKGHMSCLHLYRA